MARASPFGGGCVGGHRAASEPFSLFLGWADSAKRSGVSMLDLMVGGHVERPAVGKSGSAQSLSTTGHPTARLLMKAATKELPLCTSTTVEPIVVLCAGNKTAEECLCVNGRNQTKTIVSARMARTRCGGAVNDSDAGCGSAARLDVILNANRSQGTFTFGIRRRFLGRLAPFAVRLSPG
jgi:hypothetical protein